MFFLKNMKINRKTFWGFIKVSVDSKIFLNNMIKIVIGNLLIGLAYAKWMVPHNIINGGVTSLSLIIHKVSNIPLLYLSNGLTLVLLIICFVFLGRSSFTKSLLGSIFYIFFFTIFYSLSFDLTTNLVLDIALACIFIAIGYFLCISSGASTVGMDVIALILHNRNEKFKIALTISYLNYAVLLVGFFVFGWISVVVGIIFTFCFSFWLERMLLWNKKEFKLGT